MAEGQGRRISQGIRRSVTPTPSWDTKVGQLSFPRLSWYRTDTGTKSDGYRTKSFTDCKDTVVVYEHCLFSLKKNKNTQVNPVDFRTMYNVTITLEIALKIKFLWWLLKSPLWTAHDCQLNHGLFLWEFHVVALYLVMCTESSPWKR